MNLINELRKKIIRNRKFLFKNNSYKLIVELKKNGITNKNILDAIKKIKIYSFNEAIKYFINK